MQQGHLSVGGQSNFHLLHHPCWSQGILAISVNGGLWPKSGLGWYFLALLKLTSHRWSSRIRTINGLVRRNSQHGSCTVFAKRELNPFRLQTLRHGSTHYAGLRIPSHTSARNTFMDHSVGITRTKVRRSSLGFLPTRRYVSRSASNL